MIYLKASEGKLLFDGQTYASEIYLPDNSDITSWKEINESEKILIIGEPEEELSVNDTTYDMAYRDDMNM